MRPPFRLRFFASLGCTVFLSVITSVPLSAHPNSVSYAEFSLDRGSVQATVRLPLDDVDLLLRLDRDLDGKVSTAELDASTPAIRDYFTRHLHIAVNGVPAGHTLHRVRLWRDPSAFQYLESTLSSRLERGIGRLTIQSDFLTELYPSHRTIGRIAAAGREERFTFGSTTTYVRTVAADRAITLAMVGAGLAVLGLLWAARRRAVVAAVAALLIASSAAADVIMSAPALNATLKTLERLARQAGSAESREREEALFQLGTEADGLASLMSLEVESHGMQERELLDLALSRSREIGVAIAYDRAKKKFFYDGAAFADYLIAAPRGAHAAGAEFKLLSYQFYQSNAADRAALAAAAETKKQFLARYPRFDGNAEMRLYLAVDYQDLFRRAREAHDTAGAVKYRQLARAECLRITRLYPGSDQADAARQMLRGLKN